MVEQVAADQRAALREAHEDVEGPVLLEVAVEEGVGAPDVVDRGGLPPGEVVGGEEDVRGRGWRGAEGGVEEVEGEVGGGRELAAEGGWEADGLARVF